VYTILIFYTCIGSKLEQILEAEFSVLSFTNDKGAKLLRSEMRSSWRDQNSLI